MKAIVDEIARSGGVPFVEFMALALYHDTAGYYTRPRRGAGPAGGEGDFVTAPTASPLLAATLAHMVRRLALDLGTPVTFVELAAGEGRLIEALVTALGDDRRDVIYQIVAVETATWARARLARRVPDAVVARKLESHPRPRGPVVLFASELYDAVPCRRVVVAAVDGRLELREFWVVPAPGRRLAFETRPVTDGEPARYFAQHGVSLGEGQIAELRPGVRAMHGAALAWCGHDGVALVLDYGYPARRLYDPRGRAGGSLVGYRRHRLVENVLLAPGRCDITAHVNFDDLMAGAGDAGWDRGELRPLGSFLALHGAFDLLPVAVASGGVLKPDEWATLAAAKRLLLPSGMGSDLKVLAQGRGAAWRSFCEMQTPPPIEA